MTSTKEHTRLPLRTNKLPLDAPPSAAYLIPGLPRTVETTIDDIIAYIASVCDIPTDKLMGSERFQEYVNARKLVCLFASDKQFMGMSLYKTGLLFRPPKNHTTIIYNKRKAWEHIDMEPSYRRTYNIIKEKFFVS